MKDKESKMENLIDDLKEYAEVQGDIIKLEAADRISAAASSLAASVILGVTGVFVLIFLSAGCAWLIGYYTHNPAIGFFSIAAFYLLMGIIVYSSKDKLIKTPLVNAVLKKMIND